MPGPGGTHTREHVVDDRHLGGRTDRMPGRGLGSERVLELQPLQMAIRCGAASQEAVVAGQSQDLEVGVQVLEAVDDEEVRQAQAVTRSARPAVHVAPVRSGRQARRRLQGKGAPPIHQPQVRSIGTKDVVVVQHLRAVRRPEAATAGQPGHLFPGPGLGIEEHGEDGSGLRRREWAGGGHGPWLDDRRRDLREDGEDLAVPAPVELVDVLDVDPRGIGNLSQVRAITPEDGDSSAGSHQELAVRRPVEHVARQVGEE